VRFLRRRNGSAFEAQREALYRDDSPEAAEHRAFQTEHGLDQAFPLHPLDQARLKLRELDQRIERLDGKIAGQHDHAAKTGTYAGIRGKLDRLDAEKTCLEDLASRLWGKVHPPLVYGAEPVYVPALCRGSCGVTVDDRDRFDRLGFCPSCWEIATGRTKPPQPDADTADVEELIAQLP
jgi:hypothetical protein